MVRCKVAKACPLDYQQHQHGDTEPPVEVLYPACAAYQVGAPEPTLPGFARGPHQESLQPYNLHPALYKPVTTP